MEKNQRNCKYKKKKKNDWQLLYLVETCLLIAPTFETWVSVLYGQNKLNEAQRFEGEKTTTTTAKINECQYHSKIWIILIEVGAPVLHLSIWVEKMCNTPPSNFAISIFRSVGWVVCEKTMSNNPFENWNKIPSHIRTQTHSTH